MENVASKPEKVKEALRNVLPNRLERIKCFFGIHTYRYLYGKEFFHSWEEIKAGASNPSIEHLGWHCKVCRVAR